MFDLETPLIRFSSTEDSGSWTIRNAVEGVQIFGGIGSGKTSGSGRMIALKYLEAGFGGLVLTVKPEEKNMWARYCRAAGRIDDLIVVDPECENYFNFLEYEYLQGASENSITENIVEVLKTVIRASEEKMNGRSDDAFWETALDMLIFNVIDLCKLAYGNISVQSMYDIVQNIPKAEYAMQNEENNNPFMQAFNLARSKTLEKVDTWKNNQSQEVQTRLNNDPMYFDYAVCNAVSDARLLKFLDQFFMETFRNLSEKTRSIIDFSFSGFLFHLLREPFHSLFCKYKSTLQPEDCWRGKIILLNLPVKLYHKVGRDIQIMFKYIWQRAMEKRKITEDARPVFLWADEAQNFLHEHDVEYQATARSSRIATVYISQNLPNYYANMGGNKAEHRVKSFLGTLATKIFHANADIDTNEYASNLIGEEYFLDVSKTATAAGTFSSSKTKSYKLEKIVRPEEFVQLKTGSPVNYYRVEGYIHQQGNPIWKGYNHIKMQFNQEFSLNNRKETFDQTYNRSYTSAS